ncbi:hypothetical protein PsorP6_015560 [Peronosclerospora sorghi]|uniref:Uncharacterized protein n=1 Tax=Peronosclerospora sorghi TaxID=230839 RepID=A0ACC0WPT3_9STRA|nr:hypothetical protein PsorP6_015560 [Peronosclerospora sorghi]
MTVARHDIGKTAGTTVEDLRGQYFQTRRRSFAPTKNVRTQRRQEEGRDDSPNGIVRTRHGHVILSKQGIQGTLFQCPAPSFLSGREAHVSPMDEENRHEHGHDCSRDNECEFPARDRVRETRGRRRDVVSSEGPILTGYTWLHLDSIRYNGRERAVFHRFVRFIWLRLYLLRLTHSRKFISTKVASRWYLVFLQRTEMGVEAQRGTRTVRTFGVEFEFHGEKHRQAL